MMRKGKKMTYTAVLSFKNLACNSEFKFNLTREEAEEQIEEWRKKCGEDNPYMPVFEIIEENSENDRMYTDIYSGN